MHKEKITEEAKQALPDDKTSAIEREVQRERKPRFSYVLRLWAFVYSDRYIGLYGGEDIEQLAKIQDNRLQELLFARLYKKISKVSVEHMEIAKINDNIAQVFSFVDGSWDNGVNRGLMLKSLYNPRSQNTGVRM